tara:strand:+ start:9670 stop:10557 length:888 start_codon:yes stop_codon:yes gene_type:complete
MISTIITAYKEEKTIGKAIESILNQKTKENMEIIVVCPDKPTADAARKYQNRNKNIRILKDPKMGKPVALNIAFKKAKGDILILTDGDVYIGKNAVNELINPFKNKKIGAVSGRPISSISRNTMLGYWSHLLTDLGAHNTRLKLAKRGKFIVCSGYLYAIRAGIVKNIPSNSLSDDAIISHLIAQKGYKITYAPKAEVYVKYPTTFKDWITQKKRSTGGYNQIKELTGSTIRMRSFTKEALGIFKLFNYPKNIKEIVWTKILILARLYLWVRIFIDLKLRKEAFSKTWKRIESTK